MKEKEQLEKQLNEKQRSELSKEGERAKKMTKSLIVMKNELNKKSNKNLINFKNNEEKLILFRKQNKELNNEKIALENELRCLLNEVNLKNIQIKKQEEIYKYGKENNINYINNVNNNKDKKEEKNKNKKLIKALEIDRENLFNDNKVLLRDNQLLKDELKKAQCISTMYD